MSKKIMSKQLDAFDYGYCYQVIPVKMSKYIAFHQRSPGSVDWNTVLLIKNILCDEVIELKTMHDRIMHEYFY